MAINRRQWLEGLGAGLIAGAVPSSVTPAAQSLSAVPGAPLALSDFAPRSMLHVPESHVPRARYPVIDVHSHLSNTRRSERGVALGEEVSLWIAPTDALALMDRRNVRCMVNLTGGHGAGLETTLAAFDLAAPGRLLSCVEPAYEHFLEPNYPQLQADSIVAAAKAGARGLKVLKTLGSTCAKTSPPDRWSRWTIGASIRCGRPARPRACPYSSIRRIPEAFFLPIDRFNERYDELGFHPDWSFYGQDFPSFQELLAARDRLYARHPRTQFVSLHVGHNAENLAVVGATLDRFPNTVVELGARIGELGRQPRTAGRFFDRYQDRILFGTDAVPRLRAETRNKYSRTSSTRSSFPVPGIGGRILRLRSRRRPAARALAHLRAGAS